MTTSIWSPPVARDVVGGKDSSCWLQQLESAILSGSTSADNPDILAHRVNVAPKIKVGVETHHAEQGSPHRGVLNVVNRPDVCCTNPNVVALAPRGPTNVNVVEPGQGLVYLTSR